MWTTSRSAAARPSRASLGFTLLECVASLLLLGILATIALSVTSIFRMKAEQATLMQNELLAASSCVEQLKFASLDKGGLTEHEITQTACSGARIATPIPVDFNQADLSSGRAQLKVAPVTGGDARFFLVRVFAGSTELDYVVPKKN